MVDTGKLLIRQPWFALQLGLAAEDVDAGPWSVCSLVCVELVHGLGTAGEPVVFFLADAATQHFGLHHLLSFDDSFDFDLVLGYCYLLC